MRASILAAALAFFAGAALVAASQSPIDGLWYWQGSAGWQRILLELKADGKKLTGTMVMGAGRASRDTPSDRYWEFFVRPVQFPILNGKIEGSKISFEQSVVRGAGSMPAENLKYTGSVEDNRIVFTRQSVQRSGDAFVLGDHEYQFVATRNESSITPATAVPLKRPDVARRAMPIHVTVHDGGGRKVSGLRLEDFVILENERARSAESFLADDAPWNVVLLFDHNLTWLEGAPNANSAGYVTTSWRSLIDGATSFLEQLRPIDQFVVAAFEDRVETAMDWRAPVSKAGGSRLTVTDAPRGQKDLYGAIRWTLKKFEGRTGHRAAVVFTDGRDGRLAPRWLRTPNAPRGSARGGVVVFGPQPQRGLPQVGLPQTADSEGIEVLDPLFGLHDAAEAWEFQTLVSAVGAAGVELHFVVVGADRDPEFGPAVVGRRISGLYPGADAALDAYLAGVRARLEMLSSISGGSVHYGASVQEAQRIYATLGQRLSVGAYHFEIPEATTETSQRIDVRTVKEGLRVSRTTTGTTVK